MKKQLTVALAGNPNSGKTTVFNALTGANQHVGNYPGVTVEKKEGERRYKDFEISFVDLPGTYSLTTYTIEEIIARNFIIDPNTDIVVDVIDASNIERNLYLATQIIEMNVPLVLAFNMSDIAKQKGLVFDLEQLSMLLGAPIVETVGNKSRGIDDLLEAIAKKATDPLIKKRVHLSYGKEVEDELAKIANLIDPACQLAKKYGTRYLALKLLEQDKEIISQIEKTKLLDTVNESIEHLRKIFADEPEIVIADHRYGFISGACQESVMTTVETRHDVSDKIDAVLTHHLFGLPIFIVMMFLVFQLTFILGQYPMEWLGGLFNWIGSVMIKLWPGSPDSMILSLVVDGVISGVGGVLVFVPNILILFAAIAFLEDSGYMARAAFIMDHIMHKIGLHGKSFIPMLIGFGCSVPAIMATRILENRRSRLTTIMVIPLMSCGARLPIYVMITGAFFAEKRGLVMCLIYFIGVALAVICARLLRDTLFRGETMPFVMELPPYRLPTIRGVWIHTWQRGWMYIRKAGTIILAISIVLWFAGSFPMPDANDLVDMDAQQAQTFRLRHSVVGRIGQALEPAIKPLGFDWRIGTGLVGAAAAKEVFVSQMAITYSLGGDTHASSKQLQSMVQADYTPLQGFCIMLFCLIGLPCMATVAMTRHETRSWGWAIFQVVWLTGLAYVITFAVYQIGMALPA